MEFIDAKTIKLDKEINELDKLTLSFINILKKYSIYVIVSGYIAILFGRSRTTEDVDIIIEEIPKERWNAFYKELIKNNFWCLNTDEEDEIYDMLKTHNSIRFAEKGLFQPNFEIKFVSTQAHKISLQNKIKVLFGENEVFTAPIEMQIAYKEIILGSDKDKEDALHLRKVFGKNINITNLKKYEEIIKNE